ncbi:hypothetical protein [Streptomyces chiangmaiensis]|uniref:Uncharacterized protein n=1 Tax=Streptomyces chiangmaiensis TaxID=766497 RepID=A0ABU7FDW7_9ACTN|nr:hypothetical protein [Streptomyces chiangmaiensis]MED7821752.1 hypothetical protein [Streptomyces chiangmaiensis]
MSVSSFAPETEARFALARQVADAVLFEGSPLHPYRASAARNGLRRQFGVLVPPAWNADDEEYDFQHTECLMEPKAGATLAVELRFLRARRPSQQAAGSEGELETAPETETGDRPLVPLAGGTEERVEAVVVVDELAEGGGITIPFGRPAGEESGPILDEGGRVVGQRVFRHEEISGVLRLAARRLEGPYRLLRLTAVVENTSAWTPEGNRNSDRDAALRHSLVATHLLMGLSAGSFLSMTDPPEWARGAIAACRNLHTWPVLAGEPGRSDVVLSSPVILGDHPAVSPHTPGAPLQVTDIDAVLALTHSSPPEWREPGGVAGSDPTRAPDRVVVNGRHVVAGCRVLLNPGLRRTDAQDFFLRGRTATVEAVLNDVDGSVHLAVTVEDDPGADIRRQQGVFLYFRPDEVTPLEDDA